MRYYYLFLFIIITTACNQPKQKSFVVTKINASAKLSTSEVILNKIVWTELNKKNHFFRFKRNDDVIMFDTEATVKMGIDLNKVSEQDIKLTNDSLIIYLPQVEILNFSYPHEKVVEIFPISNFDERNDPKKVEKFDHILRLAEKDIRKKIKYLGIKDEVEENTKNILSQILTKSSFKNIDIRFKKEKDAQE